MPDQFESLFAGLRAETLPEVRPPGTAAVHRTVRRRRTTRSMAGATAVLAAAGAFAVGGLPEREHRTVPDDPMTRLTAAAQRAVDERLPDRAEQAAGLVTGGTVKNLPVLTSGVYVLAIACGGVGVLAVTVTSSTSAGPSPQGGADVSCAANPRVTTMRLDLNLDSELTVSLRGDDAAVQGDAVYSLAVAHDEDEESTSADPQSSWNAGRAAGLLPSGGSISPTRITTELPSQTSRMRPEAGNYEFRMACAGPGSVSVKVQRVKLRDGRRDGTGKVLAEEQVSCIDIDPRQSDSIITVDLSQGAELAVTVTPDKAARNRAGFAYFLARL
ncbi:hypothetical protein AB0J80_13585 [Actinoplanes sp. NPDC049548]|uniref:hypothetical protein n=1 Tax=Actinoplanes sp. NPDC049548 TaxID=3155152 RepID=UPI00343EEB25